MATTAITVNDYTVPDGADKSKIIKVATTFNTNIIFGYCKRYIGSMRSCRRDIIKKIASDVDDVAYTIHFVIKKTTTEPASITYSFSAPQSEDIIVSEQKYETVDDFKKDIDYINNQIKNIFK